MGEQESVLSLACALIVSSLVTVALVVLNVAQTFTLGHIFSPIIWLKSMACAFPLAVSIYLLVPMLSGKTVPSRTRLAMLASIFYHPLQGLTFAGSGLLLHSVLPSLNPYLDIKNDDLTIKVRRTSELKHFHKQISTFYPKF